MLSIYTVGAKLHTNKSRTVISQCAAAGNDHDRNSFFLLIVSHSAQRSVTSNDKLGYFCGARKIAVSNYN